MKFKQLNESLNSKVEDILPLDGKILNLTPEEELDHKVQQADETCKKIRLCIIQIQAVLKGTHKNTVTTPELTDQPHHMPPRNHDSSPDHHACHTKLPKLSIKIFGGDLTKWTTFWDAFDAAVHSNPYLSNIER